MTPMSSRRRVKQLLALSCLLLVILITVPALSSSKNDEVVNARLRFGRWLGSVRGDDRAVSQEALNQPIETTESIEDEHHEGHEFEGFEGGQDEEDHDGYLSDPEEEWEDYMDQDTGHSHTIGYDNEEEDIYTIPDRGDYREIFSLITRDRKFFPIFSEGVGFYDASIIPHPTKADMWIVVAQYTNASETSDSQPFACSAGFLGGVLICGTDGTTLPISPETYGFCEGSLAYLNDFAGPRHVRVFHGPEAPYFAYGSQSGYTCMGVWVQDARMLLDAFHLQKPLVKTFKEATEVQRPPPFSAIEEKHFVFWDSSGKAYAHLDIWPNRVFTEIDANGARGEDLAPLAAKQDQVCMAKYMPYVVGNEEALAQASNSLEITLCKSSDPRCSPDDSNTFIMHIFNHEFYYDGHTIYDPYVLLFQRTGPFALHAISQRPFWINGRDVLSASSGSRQYEGREDEIPTGHTERFSVTSMSWKTHRQRYHGYIDDVLLLAFGIEDSRAGGIDVTAGDLLQDLDFC